ncbi:hypothetical protein ACPCSP_12085 [Streptomyces cinereoruber]|uniref:hypothetical protein n=1 Tax=Streptomyces cinereoruber TaxID=67260 RepID=UPI0036681F19
MQPVLGALAGPQPESATVSASRRVGFDRAGVRFGRVLPRTDAVEFAVATPPGPDRVLTGA